MFNSLVRVLDRGSELERIISEELAASLISGKKALKRSKAATQKIVRRSMARVGSDLNKLVRASFTRANPLSLAPLYRHPDTGVAVSRQAKEYRASQSQYRGVRNKRGNYTAGSGFRRGVNYHLVFEEGGQQGVNIGMEQPTGSDIYESRRKKPALFTPYWVSVFRDWQKAGPLQFPVSSAMVRYMAAINAPRRMSTPRRPERDVMATIQQRERPMSRFRAALRERLAR